MSLTIVGARALCPAADTPTVDVIRNATIVLHAGRIVSVAHAGPVPHTPAAGRVLDVAGRLVTPGLVDCHTHAHFLGDRAGEFGARAGRAAANSGHSYLEIARAGGGIRATVTATRAGPPEERRQALRRRLRRLASGGVTCAEVKSGYGLSSQYELDFLAEIGAAGDPDLPEVLPTLLAAHAIPPEVDSIEARARWVRSIAETIIPHVALHRLAGRVDVFVEGTAYSPDEARLIGRAALAHGLALHLHVDQLADGGGAALAAELKAQAASHLEYTTEHGIAALKAAGTVAVLLPTASLAAGVPAFAPARRLIDAGVPVALATNLNPGTAPSESTALLFFLAAVGLRLTPAEILWAATRGGAKALGRAEMGLLEPDAPADLVVWNAQDPAHLSYHAGVNHVRTVIRAGRVIVDRAAEADRECDGRL